MCTHGDVVHREISGRVRDIDRCIAPIVDALNAAGLTTIACCCGHGHRPGIVSISDGRELLIARSYDEAREIEATIPVDIQGDSAITERRA